MITRVNDIKSREKGWAKKVALRGFLQFLPNGKEFYMHIICLYLN